MYIVNFGDEILLRGEECKTRVNFKKGRNGKLTLQFRLKTWNFFEKGKGEKKERKGKEKERK